MPKYVVERQYLLPVYQRLVVEADTVQAACEKATDHGNWEDAVEDGDSARATSINAVKCVPANVNLADSDFDPEDPASQNTHSLGRFLHEGDASTIHSDGSGPIWSRLALACREATLSPFVPRRHALPGRTIA